MTAPNKPSGTPVGAPPAGAGGATPTTKGVSSQGSPSQGASPRMGGIALNNGLILVSERYWGAAIRGKDGKIVSTSGRKPHLPVGGGGVSSKGGVPLLRGLGRFAESLLVLAQVKMRLPGVELPIQGGRVLAALVAAFTATTAVKTVAPKSPLWQEAGGALAAFIPAVLAVKNSSVSGYHGAEHKVIGGLEASLGMPTGGRKMTVVRRGPAAGGASSVEASTETGPTTGGAGTSGPTTTGMTITRSTAASMKDATKEHDRCGTNLVGPYLLATVATNLLARGRSGEKSPAASALAGAASLGMAIEALRWATTHGDTMLARLMLAPGRTVQKRLTTSEPSDAQLEVGKRALAELLRLENAGG